MNEETNNLSNESVNEDFSIFNEKSKKKGWYDVLYWLILAFRNYRTAFIVVILGLFAQSFHFYHVLNLYSNLTDIPFLSPEIHSYILAIFLSLGVLYFTRTVGVAEGKVQYDSYMNKVNGFAFFEAFVNMYYWTNKFLFEPVQAGESIGWWNLVITLPLAIAIPVVIKTYAGEIKPDVVDDKENIDSDKLNIDKKFTKGKYKGYTFEWVVKNDPDYVYNFVKNIKR